MKVLIMAPIIDGPRVSYTTRRIKEEAEKVFESVDMARISHIVMGVERDNTPKIYYKGIDLTNYDYIIPRIDSIRVKYAYNIIRFLSSLKVNMPYTPKTLMAAHNKFVTLTVLRNAGIKTPNTYMADSLNAAKPVLEKMEYPMLIKLVDSFGGEGVFKVTDKENAYSMMTDLRLMNKQMVMEEFIPNTGEDIRGFVVGDKVVASMKRLVKEGEYRANIHLGGQAIDFGMPKNMEKICVDSAKAIGAKICAIDLIEDKNTGEVMVIEVNSNPGFRALESTTGKNVAKDVVDFVASELSHTVTHSA